MWPFRFGASREILERVAVREWNRLCSGTHPTWTYGDLWAASQRFAPLLRQNTRAPVALRIPPGARLVAAQWAVWSMRSAVVPVALSHPLREVHHVINVRI